MFEKYSEYKDSGTKWFGDIPRSWQLRKLKAIASFINRGVTPTYVETSDFKIINQATFSKGYFDADNCKFTKVGPLEKIGTVKGTVFKNDILLASTGGGVLGKVAFFELDQNNYMADSHVTIIRGEGDFNSKFYYYILSINYDLINGILAQGSTNQTELQRDWLRDLVFPVPSLPEQTAIADFLDRKTAQIDQAISIKEKQIELLKERRQILIHNAVTHGLDPGVKMKDSGVEWIGEIPEHWEVFKVKNLFRLIIDPAPNNNDYQLLSLYTDLGVKPRAELEERGNKASTTDGYWLVKRDDIVVNKLLAWMGAIGISNYDGVTSPAYDILRASKKLSALYYHYLFRTPICISELRKHSRGIMDMRLRLYFDKFGDVMVPFPTEDEQILIVKHIENLSSKIATAISLKQKEIEKLKEYKSTLINSAVTGKIKIA